MKKIIILFFIFSLLVGGCITPNKTHSPVREGNCQSHNDCPPDQRCISHDGKDWFCSSGERGCYYYDPKNPTEQWCID